MTIYFTVDGNWTLFGNWTECSKSCGGGMKSRARKCTNPSPNHGGNNCFGNATEISSCNTEDCPGIYLISWTIYILYYKIQSVCVFVCVWVCKYVHMSVRNRLPNHAHCGDEAFAGDSVGLRLGQRLNFVFKKLILRYFWGEIAPDEKLTFT